jgi:dienelactone hydrolase
VGCPSTATRADPAAQAADGPFPVVVFSHCSGCVRFSSVTASERLVSHGFVVLAADHAGDTLFDGLAGDPLPLSTATLQLRLSDQQALLDALEAPPSGAWAAVAELADLSRIGAMGHSFGSVTTGLLAQEDDRVRAALGVGAPMENPLLAGVEMENLDLPLLLVLLAEDNSITEVGNGLIRSNAAEPPGPAFLAEVMTSFAVHAPKAARLVIKNHPLDPGLIDLKAVTRRLVIERELQGRVDFIDGGNLAQLCRASQGMVVNNSSAALSALGFGTKGLVCIRV